MTRSDKEVFDATKKKFGTIKQEDEIFTGKDYWAFVPVDQEGNARELSRSNPDVLPESVGMFYTHPLSDEQEEQLAAFRKAKLTHQERTIVKLLSAGHTLEAAGAKIALSKNAAYSALKRARKKISAILSTQKGVPGQ